MRVPLRSLLIAVAITLGAVASVQAVPTTFQDFNSDASGYNEFALNNVFTTSDAAYTHGSMTQSTSFSGIDTEINGSGVGVASFSNNSFNDWEGNFGSFFPDPIKTGPVTDFIDNSSSTPDFSNAWPTSLDPDGIDSRIDLYLDRGWDNGSGFDYSVAISNNDAGATHRRDFLLHVFSDGTDLYVDASNNSDLAPKDSIVNSSTAFEIDDNTNGTGWYQARWRMQPTGSSNDRLLTEIGLYWIDPDDASTTLQTTWSLTNDSDIISGTNQNVGGRNYGWFPFIDLAGGTATNGELFVDNVTFDNPEPGTLALIALGGLAAMKRRRRA